MPEAKRGFVLLPRHPRRSADRCPCGKRIIGLLADDGWVERSFAWATRFRRLVKDYERYASTLADLHLVAFTCIMLKQAVRLASGP